VDSDEDRHLDYYERVATAFQGHIEHTSLSVDAIADVAGAAAEQAVDTLLSEKKLIVIAAALDAGPAITLAELLRSGLYRERPALPTVELIARTAEPCAAGVAWIAGQIEALGQPGDLALVFAANLDDTAIESMATAIAHRGFEAVWFGQQGPGLSLVYPEASPSSRLLLNQATALCLAELIDIITFGE
jgi:phosphoheptose isomerase